MPPQAVTCSVLELSPVFGMLLYCSDKVSRATVFITSILIDVFYVLRGVSNLNSFKTASSLRNIVCYARRSATSRAMLVALQHRSLLLVSHAQLCKTLIVYEAIPYVDGGQILSGDVSCAF